MIGRTFGHYRIVEKIGAGGMGELYRAHDLQLDRDVALKVLPAGALADEAAKRQFRKEALALAKLNHPNIETVHEFSTQDGMDFLAMELIPGRTLSERLNDGPLTEKEIVRLGTQLAEGLAVAHENSVVHRDLKPANLMITPDGRLKILDFGLAHLLRPAQDVDLTQSITTGTGTISGTVPYMSPEQLRGLPVDSRSDIYAAGAVLYEMATGRRPFPQSQSLELVGAILHQSPEHPSSHNRRITPALESVILKALEKEPARRYQSAAELRVALEGMLAGSSQSAAGGRRTIVAAAGAVLAIVLLAGLVLGLNLGGIRDRLLHREKTGTANVVSPPVRKRPSVAVLGFKNVSGRPDEAWLSTALSEMLTTELAAGEQLRAVPGENVARMKINLSLPDADSYGKETLARIRNNLSADHVVLGSYIPLGGGQIRVDLRLQDTNVGEILTAASVKGDEGQIDDLVSRAGATLREKLGVGKVSAAEAVAVKATLPQNRDAARYYSLGLQKLHQFDYLHARDLLQKAVSTEPQYALAHSALAVAWKGLGYDSKAREEAKKAYDLSAGFSREEGLWVEGQYHEITNGWAKAVETYGTLFGFFPDNLDYGLRLALAQTSVGKGKDALATVDVLRKVPSAASEDARIDLAEAVAAASVGDFKKQQASAARAAGRADSQGTRLLAAQARISECSSLRYLGKPKESISVCEEAKKIFAAAGDRSGVARALNNIAVVHMEQGNLTEARKVYDESLAANREIGDKKGEAMVLNNLAGALRGQVDLAGSRRMLEQALANFREIGDKGGMARSLDNIGIVMVDEGKLEGARKRYEESLAICREIGNKSLSAYALYLSGEVHAAQGNLPAARKSHEQALALRKEIGDQQAMADTKLALAGLLVEENQFALAEAAARENVEDFRKLNVADKEALARAILAQALLAQGKTGAAREASDQAAALTQKSEDTSARLMVAIESARVRAGSGAPTDVAEAGKTLQTALAEATKEGLTGLQLQARLALGQIEIKSGERAAGRAHLAALQNDATAKGFYLIARKAAAGRR